MLPKNNELLMSHLRVAEVSLNKKEFAQLRNLLLKMLKL